MRVLLVCSALAACVLFGLIAERAFGLAAGARRAGVFAFGVCAELLSGRVPYDLGVAIGLASVLALMRGRAALALVLAALAARPVLSPGRSWRSCIFAWRAVWAGGRGLALDRARWARHRVSARSRERAGQAR